MRLLLVEDDVMVASGIKLGLTDAGYAVDWVGNGERAEDVLRTEVFDSALLNIGLPNQSAHEGTGPHRAPAQGRTTPVASGSCTGAREPPVSAMSATAAGRSRRLRLIA